MIPISPFTSVSLLKVEANTSPKNWYYMWNLELEHEILEGSKSLNPESLDDPANSIKFWVVVIFSLHSFVIVLFLNAILHLSFYVWTFYPFMNKHRKFTCNDVKGPKKKCTYKKKKPENNNEKKHVICDSTYIYILIFVPRFLFFSTYFLQQTRP